jgi:hypothetical protein
MINFKGLKNMFSHPKADLPFFESHQRTQLPLNSCFMFDRIDIAQVTYGWPDATMDGKFK